MIKKFRVWCKTFKEWEEDETALTTTGIIIQRKEHDFRAISPRNHIVEYYTGIDDYDGSSIYEGDIVKVESMGPGSPEMIGTVEFMDGMYLIISFDRTDGIGLFQEISTVTVIGNIHENKELFDNEK